MSETEFKYKLKEIRRLIESLDENEDYEFQINGLYAQLRDASHNIKKELDNDR